MGRSTGVEVLEGQFCYRFAFVISLNVYCRAYRIAADRPCVKDRCYVGMSSRRRSGHRVTNWCRAGPARDFSTESIQERLG